jgi:hypothetical protein
MISHQFELTEQYIKKEIKNEIKNEIKKGKTMSLQLHGLWYLAIKKMH